MIGTAIAVFSLAAIALIAARRPVADMQAAIFGGRIAPGCVVAEAAGLLALAAAVWVFRGAF